MQRENIAWPHWMRRYIAIGSEVAFNDLLWSVGGSPPYGGVDWKEAEAICKLIEAYRGPGQAGDKLYSAELGGLDPMTFVCPR